MCFSLATSSPLQVLFAVTASAFVNVFAPHAFHTGIPEIKVILGG
jgi:chloride channel 3/4/5